MMDEHGQKISTVEIVDLTSEDDSDPPEVNLLHRGVDEDAPIVGFAEDDLDEEDQWESGSLYDDALEELEDDGLVDMGEQSTMSSRAYAHPAHFTVTCFSWRIMHPRGGLSFPETSSPCR